MKKITSVLSGVLILGLLLTFTGCGAKEATKAAVTTKYAGMSVETILDQLTLEQKVAQMIQPVSYTATEEEMKSYDYGSLLSSSDMTAEQWKEFVNKFQKAALDSEGGIPYLYGNDDVHGVNYALGTVIFPHNIGIGAANDPDLTYEMGKAVADEARLAGMLWSFSPCVAVATDPRWGRTYESYSSDTELVTSLGTSFAKGLLEGGLVACGKHYFGDGVVDYGTGEDDRLIDRGDASLSEEEIQAQLDIYQSLVDAGVQTIMITHSSVNGVKMHQSKEYITDVLKEKMGFEGFVVSDWESIHNIEGDTLKEQVITAVNAGIDMLMEPNEYQNCYNDILEAVAEGSISEERINDAVRRIIKVKKEMGLFEDPLQELVTTTESTTGSDTYRKLACQLVEKSLVLLKNDNDILPLKKGSSIYITGPAANDTGVQCGGWTRQWLGSTDAEAGEKYISEGTTILEGLQKLAEELDFTIITDPSQAEHADLTILCIGEKPYAEWEGDAEDLDICGQYALPGNEDAIVEAAELGKPTVTCIVAGRNVSIAEYEADWDATVMCYLPGSEGGGVANVLAGKSRFSGKLPMPWYETVKDIGTTQVEYELGYGLEYREK